MPIGVTAIPVAPLLNLIVFKERVLSNYDTIPVKNYHNTSLSVSLCVYYTLQFSDVNLLQIAPVQSAFTFWAMRFFYVITVSLWNTFWCSFKIVPGKTSEAGYLSHLLIVDPLTGVKFFLVSHNSLPNPLQSYTKISSQKAHGNTLRIESLPGSAVLFP